MAITLPSKEKIEELIKKALETSKSAGEKAASSDITTKIADTLTENSDKIQSIVNNLLQKKGLITQQELDSLDELVKQTKLKMLQEDSIRSISKYGLYIAIVLFAFGTLWLITKDTKNGQ
jgi:polyhydroxyalkanoate synthesis regulator phasin